MLMPCTMTANLILSLAHIAQERGGPDGRGPVRQESITIYSLYGIMDYVRRRLALRSSLILPTLPRGLWATRPETLPEKNTVHRSYSSDRSRRGGSWG